MHDPSIMIIEKDFVIIEARLKQQQQQQKSGFWNFCFAERPWESAYYTVV